MSARDSLLYTLVELGIIPVRTAEEAQARQVIFGGLQQVCLLEIAPVKEADLLVALAQYSGLASTVPGALPVDLAKSGTLRGEGLAFLAIAQEGKDFLVSPQIPDDAELDRSRELLGAELPVLISTELRFAEANAFVLGSRLDARQIPLLDRWGRGLPDLAPTDEDRTSKAPEVVPNEPTTNAPDDGLFEPPSLEADDPPDGFAASFVPTDRVLTELMPTDISAADAAPVGSSPLPAFSPASEPSPAAMRPMSARKEPLVEPHGLVVETGPPPQGYEDFTASASEEPTSSDPSRPGTFYDRVTAEHDLKGARSRDRVVEIVSHYIACRFRSVSAFGLSGDEAKGLRASGAGAPTEVVRALTIALDLPSCFKKARDEKTPRIVRLRASGLEGGVARDLARPAGIDVLLLPIAVRGRPVLLLWADNQGLPLDPSAVSDVQDFVPQVSKALERVLLELKRKNRVVSATDSAPRYEAPALLSESSSTEPQQGQALGNVASDPKTPPPPPHRLFSGFPPAHAPSERHSEHTDGEVLATEPFEPTPAPHDGDHEVAPVAKRPLGSRPAVPTQDGRAPSDHPSHFPAEAPRTLKGFPAIGRAPRAPKIVSHETTAVPKPIEPKTSLLSRRIRPLEEPTKDREGASNPPGHSPPAKAAPNEKNSRPITAPSPDSEQPFSSPPLSAGETMVSRRDSILERLQAEVVTEGDRSRAASPERPLFSDLVSSLIDGDERALEALVRGGETAVGALIARFPGPVVEPTHPTAKASECGPVLGALVALGSKSTPFLTVRTADEDATVRRWATYVLGELPGKEAARAIASRLLDESVEVRRAALSAARRLRKDTLARRTLRSFIEQMIKDESLEMVERAAAIEALSDIREHEAIPTLLQLMEDEDHQLQRSVRWALSVLTRQDFGSDLEQWRTFWQQHRDEDRVEWLIASLDHDERDIRRAAGEELRALAGDAFGFDEDQAAGDRRAAQARFRTWWAEGGKAKH